MSADVPTMVEYCSDTEVRLSLEDGPGIRRSIKLTPARATELAQSLLAASAVCALPPPKPPAGTTIAQAYLPISAWETGISKTNGQSMLTLEVVGGGRLAFQLLPVVAQAIGEALRLEAQKAIKTIRESKAGDSDGSPSGPHSS
jgi:hypothetical protein